MDVSGAGLSRAYYEELVAPVVTARWPGLRHAAGLLGPGSEVLGFDDAVSRDHDWGLRLSLLVPRDLVGQVDAHLAGALPETFAGHRVRFATTGDPQVRHRVQVADVTTFVTERTGVDATASLSLEAWLAVTGQGVLEVTGGPVFTDTAEQLSAARDRLAWYPHQVWTYVVASDWARMARELPFIGRTGERGDDLGSRVITARLVGVAMHLAHALERRWMPYAKWAGASMAALPRAGAIATPLHAALAADHWRAREAALVVALRALLRLQDQAGLPTVDDPVEPFWDRPYQGIRDDVVAVLEESITDPAVRALPRGAGSLEQRSDNVDVLTGPRGVSAR